jgi:uncharacterized protein with PIN domain
MNTQTSFTDYLNSFTGKSKEKPTTQDHQVVAQVVQTKDYQQFNKAAGNRDLIQLHVERLKASMEQEYLMSPIIVNEKMEIIDGQHRFEAARQLNLPIRFIKVRGYALSQMQQMNALSKDWGLVDHIKAHADLGNTNFKQLMRYIKGQTENHPLSVIMTSLGLQGSNTYDKLKTGSYRHDEKREAQSLRVLESVEKMRPFYKGANRSNFVHAIMHLRKHDVFDVELFIDKLSKYSSLMVDCTTRARYIDLIEHIYNYKSRNKVSLKYLSDD